MNTAAQITHATDQNSAELRKGVRDEPAAFEALMVKLALGLPLSPIQQEMTAQIALNTLATLMAEEHPERVESRIKP